MPSLIAANESELGEIQDGEWNECLTKQNSMKINID